MIGSRLRPQAPPKTWVAFAGVFGSELMGAEWINQPNGETEKHKGDNWGAGGASVSCG